VGDDEKSSDWLDAVVPEGDGWCGQSKEEKIRRTEKKLGFQTKVWKKKIETGGGEGYKRWGEGGGTS